MTHKQISMIEEFQCFGCVCGCSTKDSCFKPNEKNGYFCCIANVAGTMSIPGGWIHPGLPRGFCKVGAINLNNTKHGEEDFRNHNIRLHLSTNDLHFDRFNLAVWAMIKDDYLFVRTYAPRINWSWIDVFPVDEKTVLPANSIDVNAFYEEID